MIEFFKRMVVFGWIFAVLTWLKERVCGKFPTNLNDGEQKATKT
jgi:hypothetical protein